MTRRISILMFLIDVMLTLIIIRLILDEEYIIGICLTIIKVATMIVSRMVKTKIKSFKTSEIEVKEEDEIEEERCDK